MPPMLVSDAERDRAVHVLREAAVSGRLTDESFLRRVDEALRTRTRGELSEVVRDLPGRSRLTDRVARSTASLSLFVAQVRSAWRRPRLERLALPADPRRAYWLGRAPGSDLLLTHASVSRGHARLHFGPTGWVLTDLHSSNGTRVNGWAVVSPVVIKPGDQVSFGAQTFVVTG